MKDELNSLKKKNADLEKKIKLLEAQNKEAESLKITVSEKDKVIADWQTKYDELMKKA